MKTALLLSGLLLSVLSPLQAAEFEPGAWIYVSSQEGNVIAGGNFEVEKSGRISGEAFYFSGFKIRLSGKINEKGVFNLSEKGKEHGFTLTGKISKTGDSFRLKITDGNRLIEGEKISDNFKEAGAYADEDAEGLFLGFIVRPSKKVISFLSDGQNFVRMLGTVKGGGFVVKAETYEAKVKKLNRSKIRGDGLIGEVDYKFEADRL